MESKKILVVDPDQLSRFIVKHSLSSGFHVTTLSSAQEAIAFIKCQSAAILLINVTLVQHMDCIDLLHQLISISPPGTFRAFATTSYITKDRIQRLLISGFEGVLLKPITLSKVEYALSPDCVAGGTSSTARRNVITEIRKTDHPVNNN